MEDEKKKGGEENERKDKNRFRVICLFFKIGCFTLVEDGVSLPRWSRNL